MGKYDYLFDENQFKDERPEELRESEIPDFIIEEKEVVETNKNIENIENIETIEVNETDEETNY